MPTKKYYGPKAEQYRAESSAYYVAHRKERLAYAKRYCKANKKKLKVKGRHTIRKIERPFLLKAENTGKSTWKNDATTPENMQGHIRNAQETINYGIVTV